MRTRPLLIVAGCLVAAVILFRHPWLSRKSRAGVSAEQTVRAGQGVRGGVQAPAGRSTDSSARPSRGASSERLAEACRLAGLADSTSRHDAITAYIATVSDPAVCAEIASDPDTFGHSLVGAALHRWVELDPQGAIRDYALKAGPRETRLSHLEWMFRQYSDQDPAAAFAFAKSVAGVSLAERQAGLAATLAAFAKTDPDTAVAELRSLPASLAAGPAAEIYREMATRRPPADVFAEAGLLGGVARSQAQQAVLQLTAAKDPQIAATLWNNVENAALRHDLTRALIEGFRDGGTSPQAVADWLYEYAPERGAGSLRAEAVTRLAEKDPGLARAMLDREPPGQRDAMAAAISSMLDPVSGLPFALEVTGNDERYTALAEVAARLASADPERLYAEAAGNAEFARAAVPSIIDALAYENTSQAVDYVGTLPPEMQSEAAQRLVSRIADTSPEQAVALAAHLVPEGDERRTAVAECYASGLVGRSGLTIDQLPTLPAGINRDEVYATTVPLVAFRNPEAAWAVAAAIKDEALRANAMQEAILGIAHVESHESARQRLAEAGLPPTAAEQILDQLSR